MTTTRDGFFLDISSFIAVPDKPKPYAQNKTLWCWAAAAKMVAEHNSGDKNPGITKHSHRLDYASGVLTSNCGTDTTDTLVVDGTQRAIVMQIKGNDRNATGDDDDSVNALRFASSKKMDVGYESGWNGGVNPQLTPAMINAINTDLNNGKYVIGSMADKSGKYGHSVVLQKYYPGKNGEEDTYVIFDPLKKKPETHDASEIFTDYGYVSEGRYCKISWYKYCRDPK